MHTEYQERDGVLRCKYCGSVSMDFLKNADEIIYTDKTYKMYIIKDSKQYKFYMDHWIP
jgi:hypothetical protein